jgi:hypothetical protein
MVTVMVQESAPVIKTYGTNCLVRTQGCVFLNPLIENDCLG